MADEPRGRSPLRNAGQPDVLIAALRRRTTATASLQTRAYPCLHRPATPSSRQRRPLRCTATTTPRRSDRSTTSPGSNDASPRTSRRSPATRTRCAMTPLCSRYRTIVPRPILRPPSGATSISSPSRIVGAMLRPGARNRTAWPASSRFRHSSARTRESVTAVRWPTRTLTAARDANDAPPRLPPARVRSAAPRTAPGLPPAPRMKVRNRARERSSAARSCVT